MALSQTQPSTSRNGVQALRALQLAGLDLTGNEHWRGVWCLEAATGTATDSPVGLPQGGIALPWGYWFYPRGSSDAIDHELWVSVHDPSELVAAVSARRRTDQRRGGRLPQTVSVAVPTKKGGELTLIVGAEGAQVFASDEAWDVVGEAVLLVVAQYCRFASIERTFITLQSDALHDHRHAATAGLRTLREQDRLVEVAGTVRTLVSDWAYFAGPCSDPARSCSSEETREAYSALAEDLDFEAWAQSIDAIVEDVEQTYESISDKLFHYRLFMWGMALEVVIIGLIAGLIVR